MLSRIHDRLTEVRIRQQMQRGLRWFATALFLISAVGVALLVFDRAGLIEFPKQALAGLLLYGAGGAFAAGLLWPSSWRAAARLVDEKMNLKDRTLTSLEFSTKEKLSEVQSLQVRDAIEHLSNIQPRQVAPYVWPRAAVPAMCALTLIVGILCIPPAPVEIVQVPEAIPVVLEQASLLEETMLEELDELAKEQEDEELEKLVEEIRENLEELQEPEVDQRDALAKLSEMQEAIAEMQRELSIEEVDAQLEKLAAAFEASQATEAASQALASGDYDKAAEELENLDVSSMKREEKEAVAKKLAKIAENLGKGRKGELSEALGEMSDGLKNDKDSQCKSGACKAAGVCKKQGAKKKISECLACQLNRLAECKSCCQGQCQKPGSKVALSDKPSDKWGLGASDNPFGSEKTKIDSTRREETLTGIEGDGPSEKETTSAPEARQQAARSYKDRYAEYRKQAEEVLNSEPLPLGHRKTIRSYFESIRPENGDELLKDSE